MSRIFDTYVMVDWSASKGRTTGKDSIWVAWAAWEGSGRLGRIDSENLPTRKLATDRLLKLLKGKAGRQRVLIGFDFPYGYPRGFASALGKDGQQPAWSWTWDYWDARIRDEDDNWNNRFRVAAEANRLLSAGNHPFWGCPAGEAGENLSTRSLTRGPATGASTILEDHRLAEDWLKRLRFGSIQSVWKLYTTGSVGSQSLMGIPRLKHLRFHPDLAAHSAVWPFETGFGLNNTEAQILHAEIWPGILGKVYKEKGTYPDERQVKSLVRHFADLDEQGDLAAEFERPSGFSDEQIHQIVEEEGWILGATTALPLRKR